MNKIQLSDLLEVKPAIYIERNFSEAVNVALQEKQELRRKRLEVASTRPIKLQTVSFAYNRNPDVVAEVLSRAKGFCEKCGNPAPFVRRTDNTPYLEVHHKIPLSYSGDDTVRIAVALCPNCHREAHFA